MMSDDYDHRWEPLAEVHFNVEDNLNDDNYLYCLCSRVFIRDGVKFYYVDKQVASESDTELRRASNSQDDHSHVHFSVDTSYKVKCEKDETASCYCSATHTDNNYSTDEHDPAQNHGLRTHSLQPSDSGADLTYPDIMPLDHTEKMQTESEYDEDYLSQVTWDKFWSINGERLIWASWIDKYSDYINPAYFDQNSDFADNSNFRKNSLNQIFNTKESLAPNEDDGMRERKFSYDSKVNPYKKNLRSDLNSRNEKVSDKDDSFVSIGRRRSCSEHDRLVSPRPFENTDSMTNVTKITVSSYDMSSSHVTSESNSTDEYSVTSSDDNCDQTKIAIIEENLDKSFSEDMDPDQYWQFLWKKHFGEQYAMHYANYVECLNEASQNTPPTPDSRKQERILEVECESEGNSQELPSVIEVQTQVDKLKLKEKPKVKKRNKKSSTKYSSSVGVLLQNLIQEETQSKTLPEVVEAGDSTGTKKQDSVNSVDGEVKEGNVRNSQWTWTNSKLSSMNTGGGEEPPDERPVNLKRSHENDEETESEKVKSTFKMIGLCMHPDSVPKGQLVYRKRFAKLRLPLRRYGFPKKTYFDDDGNPCGVMPQDSQEEREMQTDEDCPEVKSDWEQDIEKDTDPVSKFTNTVTVENKPEDTEETKLFDATAVPLPDLDESFTDQDCNEGNLVSEEVAQECTDVYPAEPAKRRRRKKRAAKDSKPHDAELPPELRGQPAMRKYWKKRHSLFHRFDSGIRLDKESWFSVTPEQVARHAAARCRCDVVVDAFCGAGGNATQLAFTCERVIAIDIDPAKIALARHNAAVYGVADRIEFIVGDFFDLAPKLRADVVFLSPPWGGPSYAENAQYDLETMLLPKPASQLMAAAARVADNVALYVPRNSRTDQLVALARESGVVELEQNFLGRRLVALTAYYGDLVNY